VPDVTVQPARRTAFLVIAAGFVVRLLIAGLLGFGVDEAYALAVSRTFQLSWFDHPPLAFWMAWAGQKIFGPEAAHLLLRLPCLLLFCGSSWMLFRLTGRLYGERAALWALISITLAPFFFLSAGGWIVPDSPLVFFLLLAANLLVRVLFEKSPSDPSLSLWAGTGLALGLAGLSKYLGVFFAAGILAFLLSSRTHRHWLARPGPWLAALVAGLVILPVIVWNAQHDWCSFAFQAGRGAPAGGGPRPGLVALTLGGQALYLMPWTFGGLIIAAGMAMRQRPVQAPDLLLMWVSIPIISLLSLAPLRGTPGLPHWEMPGWLFLFPLLGRWIADMESRGRILYKVTLGLSLGVMTLLIIGGSSQARHGWLRHVLPGRLQHADPTHELVEWQGLGTALNGLPPDTPLVTTHWRDGGRLARELPQNPVMVWNNDPRGFAFLHRPDATLGKTALIISRDLTAEQLISVYGLYFEAMEPLPSIDIKRGGGQQAVRLSVVRGVRQKQAYPLPYF
jgi:4-amino-4-deoxy-L-arabinose transferase-like glycosyltransferase